MNAIGNFLRRFVFRAAKSCCVISQENCRILRLSTTWAMKSAAGLSNIYGALFYSESLSSKEVISVAIKRESVVRFCFCKSVFSCQKISNRFT